MQSFWDTFLLKRCNFPWVRVFERCPDFINRSARVEVFFAMYRRRFGYQPGFLGLTGFLCELFEFPVLQEMKILLCYASAQCNLDE